LYENQGNSINIIKKCFEKEAGLDLRDLCKLLVGILIGTTIMENSMEVPRKIKNRDTI
jgi:hypothetical protein